MLYDLKVAPDFRPQLVDGEIEEAALLEAEVVNQQIAAGYWTAEGAWAAGDLIRRLGSGSEAPWAVDRTGESRSVATGRSLTRFAFVPIALVRSCTVAPGEDLSASSPHGADERSIRRNQRTRECATEIATC